MKTRANKSSLPAEPINSCGADGNRPSTEVQFAANPAPVPKCTVKVRVGGHKHAGYEQRVKQMAAARTAKRTVKISGCSRLSKLRKDIGLKPSEIATDQKATKLDAALRTIVAHGTDVLQKRTKSIVRTQRSGEVDEATLDTRWDELSQSRPMEEIAEKLSAVAPVAIGASPAGARPRVRVPARGAPFDDQYEDFSMERLLQLAFSRGGSIFRLAPPSTGGGGATRIAVVHGEPEGDTGATQEDESVWVESGLWTDDTGSSLFRLNGAEYASLFEQLARVPGALENFHQKWNKYDPLRNKTVSIEIGWSCYCSKHNFWIACGRSPEGEAMQQNVISKWLPHMWRMVERRFPIWAARMKETVGELGLFGTGWTKVTLSRNNPVRHCEIRTVTYAVLSANVDSRLTHRAQTLAHPDRNNWGITSLCAVQLSEEIIGSSHVVVSHDLSSAVVVEDGKGAIVVAGDYARVMHGNLGTFSGDRIILNAYAGTDVLRRAGKI